MEKSLAEGRDKLKAVEETGEVTIHSTAVAGQPRIRTTVETFTQDFNNLQQQVNCPLLLLVASQVCVVHRKNISVTGLETLLVVLILLRII